ncbi:MAG: hypothetical protein U1E65_04010 [Myxococcota bacterium]
MITTNTLNPITPSGRLFDPSIDRNDQSALVRQLFQLLPEAAREQLGRQLAELMWGGATDVQGLRGLSNTQNASSPAALPRTLPSAQPPRLGGAETGGVVVRGQDGSAFPVRDTHVSSPDEAAWVLGRARDLGLSNGTVGVQQYAGFYGIDYSQAGNNRIHTIGVGEDEGINRINVGLVAEMYRTMPKEQADAILACDLKYISGR